MKYLYCLVRGARKAGECLLEADRAVIASISVRELLAIVSDVKGDLHPPRIADVLAHHAMVDYAFACFPAVLPCRFGTTTPNQEEAIALLEGRYPQLVESSDPYSRGSGRVERFSAGDAPGDSRTWPPPG